MGCIESYEREVQQRKAQVEELDQLVQEYDTQALDCTRQLTQVDDQLEALKTSVDVVPTPAQRHQLRRLLDERRRHTNTLKEVHQMQARLASQRSRAQKAHTASSLMAITRRVREAGGTHRLNAEAVGADLERFAEDQDATEEFADEVLSAMDAHVGAGTDHDTAWEEEREAELDEWFAQTSSQTLRDMPGPPQQSMQRAPDPAVVSLEAVPVPRAPLPDHKGGKGGGDDGTAAPLWVLPGRGKLHDLVYPHPAGADVPSATDDNDPQEEEDDEDGVGHVQGLPSHLWRRAGHTEHTLLKDQLQQDSDELDILLT